MARRARSARGEMVDFDLIQIKEQIGSRPPTLDVKRREDFIDKKLRRRIKRAKERIDNARQPMTQIEVEPTITEPPVEQRPLIDAPKDSSNKTKQKARPNTIGDIENADDVEGNS